MVVLVVVVGCVEYGCECCGVVVVCGYCCVVDCECGVYDGVCVMLFGGW